MAVNPHKANASVPNIKGAPNTAPEAISICPPRYKATIGITDSGRAVPTAAKILPVTVLDKLSLLLSHSAALVNNSAPIKIRISPPKSKIGIIITSGDYMPRLYLK